MPTTYRPLAPSDLDSIATIHREACLTAYAFMGWNYSWRKCRDWYAGKLPEWDWGLVAVADGPVPDGGGVHPELVYRHSQS